MGIHAASPTPRELPLSIQTRFSWADGFVVAFMSVGSVVVACAEQLTVVGRRLQPGDPAPDFTLARFDAGAGAMRQVRLSDSSGTVRLLNVINSLDTPVCHAETRRWDELRANLPEAVR